MSNADRNRQIYKEFHEDKKSVNELSQEWELTVPRIYQILADVNKRSAEVVEKIPDSKALSQAHVQVGLKFYAYRHFTAEDELDETVTKLRWSSKKIGQVERGETQLTLSDLLQLAQYMQVSLAELFQDSRTTGSGA